MTKITDENFRLQFWIQFVYNVRHPQKLRVAERGKGSFFFPMILNVDRWPSFSPSHFVAPRAEEEGEKPT